MHRSPQAAADALAALQQQQLRRTRRTVQGYADEAGTTQPRWGQAPLVNFCGNDYLGLARDPRLTAALERARALLRQTVPTLTDDRYFAPDMAEATHLVTSGALLRAVGGDLIPIVAEDIA